MSTTVLARDGARWTVSRRLVVRPRLPRAGRMSGGDAFDMIGAVDGVSSLVLALLLAVAILVLVAVFPFIVFALELGLILLVGCWQAVRGRRYVVAESDRERVRWTARGQSAAERLVAEIVVALEAGASLPVEGQHELRSDAGAIERP